MSNASRGAVLVSGASIAGPATAYWLHRYGYDVTVVEKSAGVRAGGYPIDVRGTALEAVRRMGILPQLQAAHVDSRRMTFLNADGSAAARVHPQAVVGGVDGRDLEVRRGDLADILYAAVRDDVEFVFGDSIEALTEHDRGVDAVFRSGAQRSFDLVIGADGMHSRTRGLVFGPEERYARYLGYCFSIFTMPNTLGLSHEAILWNTPGRAAALYAVGDGDVVHAMLNFARPEPPQELRRDPEAFTDLVAEVFAGDGWEIPAVLDAMRSATDRFSDTVGQIRMPHWSRGRTALVGDAGYAPSFLTGQGSSLALAGAYMLAEALATHGDHAKAFAAYEGATRGFVEVNQAQVDKGEAALFPTTAAALERRNERLRALTELPPQTGRPAHTALTLPDPASGTRTTGPQPVSLEDGFQPSPQRRAGAAQG
ncbi:FAD-dependent monooxygenase [Glycomyces artemisiae]|uniref:2-polyprenyl-6-methoxyphenol hydroxylase-like FAD-dependent oxidoreductase n=1 Tax=Glycomyces artemisiae TaxID=1076443 RepID=A0A2T0UPN0_9ACTN|nr:FAD-dependent monooxygenase [Glycomyces artemisiae]PRY59856.1 2-polyprenyl-6-methoxyphenol hydroxylase-like FAD-dependent oxidoreductase [Glycomyces artemisiae]